MPSTNPIPATDSANELRPILGDDATATFEDDPNFVNSNPGENGSSENEQEQKDPVSLRARDTDDEEDEDDDFDEDEDDEDEDDEDDDEDYEDDEDLEDDEEDQDDDEDDLDDEDEEDDDEDEDDDADELEASAYRMDGLLGYEDEADDARKGIDRKQGDAERAEAEEELKDGELGFDPSSHTDGKWEPVERDDLPEEEGALIEHRNDDPEFIQPYRAAAAFCAPVAAQAWL